jgi:hypothetical protein
MLEYEDLDERGAALARLRGIDDRVWVQAAEFERVYAMAHEDLQRADAAKTAAVHFLRFELVSPLIAAMKGGAGLRFGIDHPHYRHEIEAPRSVSASLIADLA